MTENLIRIIVEILFIVVILLGIVWRIVITKKNNPGKVDLEMIPGHSEECIARGDELTRLIANYEHVVKSLAGIDESLANLWRHVKTNGTGGQ